MSLMNVHGTDLCYEDKGEGVPILLIHAGRATASTWGRAVDSLAEVGRVVTYDLRGYERRAATRSDPFQCIRLTRRRSWMLWRHHRRSRVGISVSATIAIDLALRRPDLMRAVVAHESPRRVSGQPPTIAQLAAFSRMGLLLARGRHPETVAAFLRFAYSYRDGGSAWEAFPHPGEFRSARGRSPKCEPYPARASLAHRAQHGFDVTAD